MRMQKHREGMDTLSSSNKQINNSFKSNAHRVKNKKISSIPSLKAHNSPGSSTHKKRSVSSTPKNTAKPAPAYIRSSPKSDLKNNLKSQSPLNRRLSRQSLPAEPGTKRRSSAPQYYKLKKSKESKRRSGVFRRTALLVFIFYSVIMLSSIILFSLKIPKTSSDSDNYLYQTATKKSILSKEWVPLNTIKSGDTFYLNMNKIAELYGMIITGDSESMKYTVRESGEFIELILGQSLAYINGIPQRMEAPCKLSNGSVFISADFVNRCFNSITVDIDRELKKITLTRETDSNGDFVQISFPYKVNQINTAIDFFSLSDELKTVILSSNKAETDSNLSKPDL